MKTRNVLLFALFWTVLNHAQPGQYYKDSEMKGFPSSLKLKAGYETVSNYFDYFKIDEPVYNAIFYRSFNIENAQHSSYKRMDVVMTKPLEITLDYYPNYKIILNPKIEKGYYSSQTLMINVREESVEANFQTDCIEWVFPENILQTKDKLSARLRANIGGIDYFSNGALNKFHGIIIKKPKAFSLEPAIVPETFLELVTYNKAEVKFINEQAAVYPNLIFENNALSAFFGKYKQNSKREDVKTPNAYKSAILLKHVGGKINFKQPVDCDILEIYFFENVVAAVLEIPISQKEAVLEGINRLKKVVNRSDFKLKPDGEFPTIIDTYGQSYYKAEEDFQSIKIYFIIVK